MSRKLTWGIWPIAAFQLLIGVWLLRFIGPIVQADLSGPPQYDRGMASVRVLFFFGPVSIGLIVGGILLILRRAVALLVSAAALGFLLLLALSQLTAFLQTDFRYFSFTPKDYRELSRYAALALFSALSAVYLLRLHSRSALTNSKKTSVGV